MSRVSLPGLDDHPHARAVLAPALRLLDGEEASVRRAGERAGADCHAYLFHGPAGVGKRTVARAFAAALLRRGVGRSRGGARARGARGAPGSDVGDALRRGGNAGGGHRPGRGRRGGPHAVRVAPAGVRAGGRAHAQRPGRQPPAEDARGAPCVRALHPAGPHPARVAADDRLALPAGALRPAGARAHRGAPAGPRHRGPRHRGRHDRGRDARGLRAPRARRRAARRPAGGGVGRPAARARGGVRARRR